MSHRFLSQRGTALVETALTLPILLLVSVGIFEFGRAYQTWQVLTNAAREGARVAILPNAAADASQTRARAYLQSGQLSNAAAATITVDSVQIAIGAGTTATASRVTVSYPFEFIVLQPVAQLVVAGTLTGAPIVMTASAAMRNETQF